MRNQARNIIKKIDSSLNDKGGLGAKMKKNKKNIGPVLYAPVLVPAPVLIYPSAFATCNSFLVPAA